MYVSACNRPQSQPAKLSADRQTFTLHTRLPSTGLNDHPEDLRQNDRRLSGMGLAWPSYERHPSSDGSTWRHFHKPRASRTKLIAQDCGGLQSYLEESLVVQHEPPLCPGVMRGQGAACGGREEETGLEEGEGELNTESQVAQIKDFILTGIPSACLSSRARRAREELTES
jgi:hypothetical protein